MNALKRENYQRNAITRGLSKANPDDLVLISDADEIPNLTNLDVEKISNEIILFKQNFYYYKFNLKLKDIPWLGTKACKYKLLKSPLYKTVKSGFSGTTPNLYSHQAIKKSGGCNVKLFIEDYSLVLGLSLYGNFCFIDLITSPDLMPASSAGLSI